MSTVFLSLEELLRRLAAAYREAGAVEWEMRQDGDEVTLSPLAAGAAPIGPLPAADGYWRVLERSHLVAMRYRPSAADGRMRWHLTADASRVLAYLGGEEGADDGS